jgi:hypothetical protein
VAPNYANIFMGWFEREKIMKTRWDQYIRYYGQYIDDIVMIFTGTEDNLKEFLEYMSGVHHSIKFTWEYSTHCINFLDIKLSKDTKGYLSTDLYRKKIDTNGYLHKTSAHPRHIAKSIPYSQFLRIKRIVSDPENIKKRINQLIEYFVCSGYSRKSLKSTAKKVLTECDSKPTRSKPSNRTTRMITTYNELLPDVGQLIKKHWSITQTNSKCRETLTEVPNVIYKRNKNLSDLLVRAKFRAGAESLPVRGPAEVSKCSRCSWCIHITEGRHFRSRTTGENFAIKHNMNCVSPWVIYLCECKKHKIQYIEKVKLN